ncbi:family 10 glycosylhydrolase [Microcoleus sp. LEGE 07076]|uniref:family 10 glycosylhydrolase n=1 Tax=Microcoleus sp. LEGE 07076 TaxID=915322 RepID=UPI0018826AEA|nr:family 10 glycosylhydrolase [Microcoleus sp. LEGE 07076]MBE9185517.1 family 10 glycosylhydrolase [Microcoleus sp. LEGE 07076]
MRKPKTFFLSSWFAIGLTISFLLIPGWFSNLQNRANATLPPQTAEFRAFWVDAFNPGFKTPQEVTKLIADAQRANANAIVAQVRRRGDAFYTSSIEPRTIDPNVPPGFDPLQDLIDKAHAAGIEVHAWMVTLPVVSGSKLPAGHVWQTHGPSAPGRDNWAMLTSRGESPGFLDPGHPDALDYTVSVYLDLLKRYDVDGVQLDYVRYGGPNWGYNPTSIARFNQQTGRTGKPAPADPAWMQWRREQVTNLVRKLYVEALAIKPRLKITAATIAWGDGPKNDRDWMQTQPYKEVLQDWRAWLEEGILDMAMPMTYQREYKRSQKLAYDNWIEYAKDHQYNRQIAIGPGNYLNYIEDTLAQVRRAEAPSAKGNHIAGTVLYSYASSNIYANVELRSGASSRDLPRQPWKFVPQSNDLFYTALSQPSQYVDGATGRTVQTQPVWATAVAVPDMPWKSRPTAGAIAGVLQKCDSLRDSFAARTCDGASLTLQPIGAGGKVRQLRADGKGWFGAIELSPGSYLLKLEANQVQQTVDVVAGEVTKVDFASL